MVLELGLSIFFLFQVGRVLHQVQNVVLMNLFKLAETSIVQLIFLILPFLLDGIDLSVLSIEHELLCLFIVEKILGMLLVHTSQ